MQKQVPVCYAKTTWSPEYTALSVIVTSWWQYLQCVSKTWVRVLARSLRMRFCAGPTQLTSYLNVSTRQFACKSLRDATSIRGVFFFFFFFFFTREPQTHQSGRGQGAQGTKTIDNGDQQQQMMGADCTAVEVGQTILRRPRSRHH